MKITSSRLFDACASIPPVRARNLLPLIIMLSIWILLGLNGVAENVAFVVSVVTAQSYLVWRNLPMAAQNLNTVQGPKTRLLCAIVGATFLLAMLQLWLANPLFTQRLLTVMCTFFLMIMILGILRERDLMERLGPAVPAAASYTAPVSLLRVNAIAAALIVAMNEWLIYFETPAVWITVMPVFMLVMHGVYWLMVLLTLAPNAEEPA